MMTIAYASLVIIAWVLAVAVILRAVANATKGDTDMDLLDYVPARRLDPHTSKEAAKKIMTRSADIRREVEAYALLRGSHGFTDYEMDLHFGARTSTYRTRRSELTDKGTIVPTRQRRATPSGRTAIVWCHRDYKETQQ